MAEQTLPPLPQGATKTLPLPSGALSFDNLDKKTGAPKQLRATVSAYKKPLDKLKLIQKYYPNAIPFGGDNYVFRNPKTKQPTLFNPGGFDVGDVFEYGRILPELVGGAIGGALGGISTSPTVVGVPVGVAAGAAGGSVVAGEIYDQALRSFFGAGAEDTRKFTEYAEDVALQATIEGLSPFPIAKGGTGSIPGAFGTGKTVTLHQIAKWADSQVVVYIGCGERGNEMTEVLVEFPELKDPRTGKPLMDRTVLVANTSNMPVAAREASIYTGVTIAEYYRDMGKDVVLVADSTSRWAESLREMSGRLEEMPAEEGYPSYLASRLAEFYERAGRVRASGSPDRDGSVTLVGAVSPSGGDITEPVTTHTMRFIKTFWALDAKLAYSRHYPSINWMNSYSGYLADIAKWWGENINEDWLSLRSEAYGVLQREDTLKEIVRLLGPEALPDEEKLILEVARMIKIGLLQQNSFDDVDTYCSPEKQYKLLKLLVEFYRRGQQALKEGADLADIRAMSVVSSILKARMDVKDDEMPKLDQLDVDMKEQFKSITGVKVQN